MEYNELELLWKQYDEKLDSLEKINNSPALKAGGRFCPDCYCLVITHNKKSADKYLFICSSEVLDYLKQPNYPSIAHAKNVSIYGITLGCF